jgi:PPE-repeat protein
MKFSSGVFTGIGATVAATILWRKYHGPAEAAFGEAADSVAAWSETAAEQTGEAASHAADSVSAWSHTAAEVTGEAATHAADSVSAWSEAAKKAGTP